jgi:hypothetical protein
MDTPRPSAVAEKQERGCEMKRHLFSLLIVAFMCLPASGDDNGKYVWSFFTETQSVLTKDGKVVGQWYYPEGAYYPWDGEKNLPVTKPPVDPPKHGSPSSETMEDWQKNGIERQDRDQTNFSGRVIDSNRIAEAFNGTLTDDSDKGYFIIIAKDKARRDKVLADWHKLPTNFTSRYNVWLAAPDSFSMMDRFSGKPRFFVEGDPTIELMQRDGTVLFRRPQCEQKYTPGDMQDLLKSDPDYKPELDPGAPEVESHIHISTKMATSLLVLAVGVLLFLFRRKL